MKKFTLLLFLFNLFCIHLIPANPLHDAIKEENITQIQKILDSKTINVNEQDDRGYALLHFLTGGEKDYVIANLLIKAGAQIDIQDQWGNTPLHELIFCELNFHDEEFPQLLNVYTNLIHLYIKSGANLTLRNKGLQTPLLKAMIHKSYVAVKILLTSSKNIDINAKDDGQITALHIAAMDNTLDIAELLIKAGANINQCDNFDHVTPLHLAVFENAFETAQFLIKSGANTSIKDRLGFTPYDFCKTTQMRSLFSK